MRYEKGHKEATRRKIVEVASKRFRQDGVEAVGVAGLMADAGLTHGGFYAHFDSKEDLVRQAVGLALDRSAAILDTAVAGGELEAIIRRYLSPQHRDHPGEGCVTAALASEIARRPESTRQALAAGFDRLAAALEAKLPFTDADERRKRAGAILSVMIGALQLARVETDEARSRQWLEGGVAAALLLAGTGGG